LKMSLLLLTDYLKRTKYCDGWIVSSCVEMRFVVI